VEEIESFLLRPDPPQPSPAHASFSSRRVGARIGEEHTVGEELEVGEDHATGKEATTAWEEEGARIRSARK
jgi:hypothetical protein